MIFLSIDIESSGLDFDKCQLLEFGAILEDTNNLLSFEDIPKFECIINRTEIFGEIVALDMNKRIIEILKNYHQAKKEDKLKIKEQYNIIEEHELAHLFSEWLKKYIVVKGNLCTINVAGKNFHSFDRLFLQKIPNWKKVIRIRQRAIDPSILYVDWKNDENLPSLGECLNRAGLYKDVTHKAIEDAWDVIQLLRKKY